MIFLVELCQRSKDGYIVVFSPVEIEKAIFKLIPY